MKEIILFILLILGAVLNNSNFLIEFCDVNIDFHFVLPILSGLIMFFVIKEKNLKKQLNFFLYILFFIGISITQEMERQNIIHFTMPLLSIFSLMPILLYLITAYSFWKNIPFFINFYQTKNKYFLYTYKIIAILYIAISIYSFVDFIKLHQFIK